MPATITVTIEPSSTRIALDAPLSESRAAITTLASILGALRLAGAVNVGARLNDAAGAARNGGATRSVK